MKALICLSLLVAYTYGALLGANKCAHGPSYWCENIKTAKECSAVSHCTTAWKTKVLDENDSDICTFCEDMVKDINIYIKANFTKDAIKAYVKRGCAYFPDTFSQTECMKIAEHYFEELYQMIEQDVSPKAVCQFTTLCNSIKSGVSPVHASPVGDVQCDACKALMAQLKEDLNDASTQASLMQYAQTECEKLESQADACKQLVQKYMPVVLANADTLFSGSPCAKYHICSDETESTPAIDYKSFTIDAMKQVMNFNGIQQVVSSQASSVGDEQCDTCRALTNQLQIDIRDPDNMALLIKYLHTECEKLGSLADTCEQILPSRSMIEYALSYGIGIACSTLKICTYATESMPVVEYKSLVMTVMKQAKISQRVQQDSTSFSAFDLFTSTLTQTKQNSVQDQSERKDTSFIQCTVCKLIIKKLESMIVKHTEEQIVKAVEKVCSILPKSVRHKCDSIIEKYGSQIIKLIVKGASPGTICTAIRQCSLALQPAMKISEGSSCAELGICNSSPSATKQNSVQRVQTDPKSASSIKCEICEFIIKQLEDMLTKNATEEEIIKALDKVCSPLSGFMKQACDELVEQYTSTIIKLIIKGAGPDTICTAVGLCSIKLEPAMKISDPALPATSSIQCVLCEFAMKKLEDMLTKNATEEQIIKAVEAVCSLLPSMFRDECDTLIEQYSPMIIKLIINGAGPQKICAAIGLCSSTQSDLMVMGSQNCIVCELGMGYLKKVLQDSKTDGRIIKKLEAICVILSPDLSGKCFGMLDQYGVSILQSIASNVNAKGWCAQLGFCPASTLLE